MAKISNSARSRANFSLRVILSLAMPCILAMAKDDKQNSRINLQEVKVDKSPTR